MTHVAQNVIANVVHLAHFGTHVDQKVIANLVYPAHFVTHVVQIVIANLVSNLNLVAQNASVAQKSQKPTHSRTCFKALNRCRDQGSCRNNCFGKRQW